jgi:hypothetical protein
LYKVEPAVGIEPTTDGLQNRCSTTELRWRPTSGKIDALSKNLLASHSSRRTFGKRALFGVVPPLFTPTAQVPKHKQSSSSPDGIQQNVPRRTLAARHKGLVNFIRHRKARCCEPGDSCMASRPTGSGPPRRAPEQGGEERVFSEVRAFARREYRRSDGVIRGIWKQPAHDWFDDAGGMVDGFFVARCRKDDGRPEQDRQPVFEEPFEFRHGA